MKGTAVAAGTAILGIKEAAAAHPDRVTLVGQLVLHGLYGSLPDQLQKGVELLEAEWPDLEVKGWVAFDIFDERGESWLKHEVWNDSPTSLQVKGRKFFEERDWNLVQHAVRLRVNGWWRQEHKFCGTKEWAGWYCNQFSRPFKAEIRFIGTVIPRPLDVETIKAAGSDRVLHVRIMPEFRKPWWRRLLNRLRG